MLMGGDVLRKQKENRLKIGVIQDMILRKSKTGEKSTKTLSQRRLDVAVSSYVSLKSTVFLPLCFSVTSSPVPFCSFQ